MEAGLTTTYGGQGTVLETERLLLRYLTDDDVDALLAVLGDPVAMQYYPHTFAREDAARWVARSQERYRTHGYGLFAVVAKSDGAMIGDCGLIPQEVEGEPMLEVAYHLRRDRWGHGFATEAARACMNYAFRTLAAGKIVSLIRAENLPSRRVAERNGLKVEREVIFHDLPHLLYAMTRENYGQA